MYVCVSGKAPSIGERVEGFYLGIDWLVLFEEPGVF